MEHTKLTQDQRAIQQVSVHVSQTTYKVHSKSVTKIEAYDEQGEGAYVPWIAIYTHIAGEGNRVWKRLPASMCEISYY